jgi:DNA-binding sugar fermentation-stimulating protein
LARQKQSQLVAQVGVHSALANKCVAALLDGNHIQGLQQYAKMSQEVAIEPLLLDDPVCYRMPFGLG